MAKIRIIHGEPDSGKSTIAIAMSSLYNECLKFENTRSAMVPFAFHNPEVDLIKIDNIRLLDFNQVFNKFLNGHLIINDPMKFRRLIDMPDVILVVDGIIDPVEMYFNTNHDVALYRTRLFKGTFYLEEQLFKNNI